MKVIVVVDGIQPCLMRAQYHPNYPIIDHIKRISNRGDIWWACLGCCHPEHVTQIRLNGWWRMKKMMKFRGDMTMSWIDQLMKMLRRWSCRSLKININAKVQVLFERFQSQCKNSRISDQAFREVFQAQHISKVRIEVYMKNVISLSTPRRRQASGEEDLHLAWSKHVSSQGIFL